MKKVILLFLIAIFLVLGNFLNAEVTVDFDRYFDRLKSTFTNENFTELQRKEMWDRDYKNQLVFGRGIVTDVEPAIFTEGVYVYVKTDPDISEYNVILVISDKWKAGHLRKGANVNFEGRFSSFSSLFFFAVTLCDVTLYK